MVVAVPSLFISTPCAEATVAGDAALLAQQIAQFIQDLCFDIEKWDDVADRLKEVRKISQIISKGSQAYSSLNNLKNSMKAVIRAGQKLEGMHDYLVTYGSNFRIDRALHIYNKFMRQTANLFEEVETTIKTFDSLRDLKPLELLQAIDDATSSVAGAVGDLEENAMDDTVGLCHDTAIDLIVEQNKKVYSSSWVNG